ncbi:WhiB family transcriptional regulator [bacterium]|nr:WhiB family transcriptional regulator [bacterium]
MALSQEFYFHDPDERPWVVNAGCRDSDADTFFPGPDGDAELAVRICMGCPVRQECLDWAIEIRIAYGVWGGTTERERRRFLRKTA